MRFISRFGKYGTVIRRDLVEYYASGASKVIQTPINAMFQEGRLLPAERELALTHFTFNGSYQEMDEVTTVAPDYRIGSFDTREAQQDNQWTDEERRQVEEELLRLAALAPGDLLAVPEIRLAPPWPRYDDYDGSLIDLMQKIVDDGYRLEDVLVYERENQERYEVIEALEQMIEDEQNVPTVEEVFG